MRISMYDVSSIIESQTTGDNPNITDSTQDIDDAFRVGNNYAPVGDEKYIIGKVNRDVDDAFKV